MIFNLVSCALIVTMYSNTISLFYMTVCALMFALCAYAQEETIAVEVNRRDVDMYSVYNQTEVMVCNEDNNFTYLVEDDQCINNDTIFQECSFAIIPNDEHTLKALKLTVRIQNGSSESMLMVTRTNNSQTNTRVVFVDDMSLRNISLCNITSLEVYRGREQIIDITHNGFSLSNTGIIEFDHNRLAYSYEDYMGELYRMNVSCPENISRGVPQSGCLVFKVYGSTDISKAKFNNSVPGTLSLVRTMPNSDISTTDITNNAATRSTTQDEDVHGPQVPGSTMITSGKPVEETKNQNPLALAIGSPLFNGLTATGIMVVILLICVIIISALIGYRRRAALKDAFKFDSENDAKVEEGEAAYTELESTSVAPVHNESEKQTVHDDKGDEQQDFQSHLYAEIGPTYQELMPSVPMTNDSNTAHRSTINSSAHSQSESNYSAVSKYCDSTYNTLHQVGGAGQLRDQCKEFEVIVNGDTNSEDYAKLDRT